MRALLLSLVFASLAWGCSFGGEAGQGPDAQPIDAPVADIDAELGLDAAILGLCDAANVGLGGCWKFENNLLDSTSNDNDGAGFNSPQFSQNGFEGVALLVAGDQGVTLGESPSLDGSALTVEARINAAAFPGTGNEGLIFDNQSQYALALFDGDGKLRCVAAGGPILTSRPALIALDTWFHVACTVDAQRIRMFVNGDEITCAGRVAPAVTNGVVGSSMGFDLNSGGLPAGGFYTGRVDNLRVFQVARTAAQICESVGRSGCTEILLADCN